MIKAKRIMTVFVSLALSLNVMAIPAMAKSDVTHLYVATNGNDANDGSIERPLATIQAARDKIRELKKAGAISKNGAVVNIREGSYDLSETIYMTLEDSGTENAPIVYRGYRNEAVELVGGKKIDPKFLVDANQDAKARLSDKSVAGKLKQINLFDMGFMGLSEPYCKGEYSYYPQILEAIKLTTGATKTVPPRNAELFINGESMLMSQYPNEGEAGIEITKVMDGGDEPGRYREGQANYIPPGSRTGKGFTVQVKKSARMDNWANAEEPLIYGFFGNDWADQSVPMESIEGDVIKSTVPSYYGISEGRQIYIYNLLEEIDVPGEFYINRTEGMLYIYPPEGSIDTMYLSQNNDGIFYMNDVSNVIFRNLKMTCGRGRAIYYEKGNNNLIDRCEFSNFAGDYTVFMHNSKNTGVINSYFHDNDGGVITYGDSIMGDPWGCYIENNEIRNSSRITKSYKAGVALQGCGNRASYNDIYNGDHLLVSFSGVENTIEYNDIWNACESKDDMGAVYSNGRNANFGHKIMYNYIHDVGTGPRLGSFGVQGIYLDDFLGDITIYGNILSNINHGSAIKGGGTNNIVSNNIIANSTTVDMAIDAAREANSSNVSNHDNVYKAIPEDSRLWKDYNIMESRYTNGIIDPVKMTASQKIENNLIYNSTKKISASLTMQPNVKNNLMTDEDPGFYNADEGIWLLKPDSDINSKIEGFTPIPFTRIGTYTERALKRIENALVFTNDEPLAIVNGEVMSMNEAWSVNTFTENDTMYIPLRFAAENLGATVNYIEQTGGVSVVTGSKVISIDKDLANVTVGGEAQNMLSSLKRKDGVTYIGFDDFANLFGMETYKGKINVLSSQKDIFSEKSDKEIINYLALLLTDA